MAERADPNQRAAERRNRKAAEQAPLLAYMGAIPQVTAEDVAARKAAIVAHGDEQRRKHQLMLEEWEAEIVQLVGREALDEALAAMATTPRWAQLYGCLERAKKGLPLVPERPKVPEGKERRPVAVEAVLGALRCLGGCGTVSRVQDQLGGGNILDVVEALVRGREMGLAEVVNGGGWRLCG